MKIIITSILLLCVTLAMSQNTGNTVIFSNTGQRFIVILNGTRINDNFETNVKLTNLTAEFYKIKLLFEKGALKQKDFNLYVHIGQEITYELKTVKNRTVLRFNSEAPLVPTYMPPVPMPVQSAPIQSLPTGNGIANAPIINMPININVGNGVVNNAPNSGTIAQPIISPYGCPSPMSGTAFGQAKQSINTKPFEDNKLQIAKQVLGSNCLTCAQVKEIIMLFNFEDSRLDFAKFAYGRAYDYGNYFIVNDAFKFSDSIDQLNSYIQSFQR
ncbi:MAG: DUF4476 domain-containing protein [Bacteroidia bacterium]|nr:DUF4476 domain-containing protein [Bacteroidia bacterium]